MRTVISISNHKGGVGKSTTAVALSVNLTRFGKKVQLIDMDPQGDLTTLLKLNLSENGISTSDAILGTRGPIWPAYQLRSNSGIFDFRFTPARAELQNVNTELQKAGGKNLVDTYREKIDLIQGADYVIINCPPALDFLTWAAISVSDHVIIPSLPHPLSLEAIERTMNYVGLVANGNPFPRVLGILLTMYEGYNIHREIKELLNETYPGKVFETAIRKTVLMEASPLRGMLKDPLKRDTAAADYLSFTKEVLSRTDPRGDLTPSINISSPYERTAKQHERRHQKLHK